MNTNSPQFIGAVKDEWQLYSDRSQDYTLGDIIGFGASSIVYTALYHPPAPADPIPCALKVVDLDSLPPHSWPLLQRETTLMSLSKHPNVLRVRGSWMDGHKLYIAMRLMNKGSAADVMRYGWTSGMSEEVVKCILKQALEGLNYLHINGFIHRDIKAANLLIDDDGTVLLGDLGVAANLADDVDSAPRSSTTTPSATTALSRRAVAFDEPTTAISKPRMGKRKSFVGTPCWMAPELIQGKQYDSSADIWSFGITALELTQGRPPRSRESSGRVLLRIVQDAPPTFNRDGGQHKYSRAFKEVVESCLVKDPMQRPTAEQLLQTAFFRSSKKKSYLVGAILENLPPLTERQERRRKHISQIYPTVDSWDFALSANSPSPTARSPRLTHASPSFSTQASPHASPLGSPTTSVHPHSRLSDHEDLRLASDLFARKGTGVGHRRMGTGESGTLSLSGRHSKAVSWADSMDDMERAGEHQHTRAQSHSHPHLHLHQQASAEEPLVEEPPFIEDEKGSADDELQKPLSQDTVEETKEEPQEAVEETQEGLETSSGNPSSSSSSSQSQCDSDTSISAPTGSTSISAKGIGKPQQTANDRPVTSRVPTDSTLRSNGVLWRKLTRSASSSVRLTGLKGGVVVENEKLEGTARANLIEKDKKRMSLKVGSLFAGKTTDAVDPAK